MELGSRLSSLEKEIGAKSNLYISSVEQIKQFESDIKLYKDKLSDLHKEVREAQVENKKIIQSYLNVFLVFHLCFLIYRLHRNHVRVNLPHCYYL
jgi:chromosome segregation ATPase